MWFKKVNKCNHGFIIHKDSKTPYEKEDESFKLCKECLDVSDKVKYRLMCMEIHLLNLFQKKSDFEFIQSQKGKSEYYENKIIDLDCSIKEIESRLKNLDISYNKSELEELNKMISSLVLDEEKNESFIETEEYEITIKTKQKYIN